MCRPGAAQDIPLLPTDVVLLSHGERLEQTRDGTIQPHHAKPIVQGLPNRLKPGYGENGPSTSRLSGSSRT
jgi:hypothetical protein